jgi:hypothetical protein
MNYSKYLTELANKFEDTIRSTPDCYDLDTEDFGWYNARYSSELFRMAHVERYSDEKIEVLHVTTFPYQNCTEPIFGFDVIATKNKPVGGYMDLSPGITSYNFVDIDFLNRKPLPEWATVFSDNFLLISPSSDDELTTFCEWAVDKYKWYIEILTNSIKNDILYTEIVTRQNNYCEVQSKNPRTFSVLKAKLGEERAKYFMEEILFPKIK